MIWYTWLAFFGLIFGLGTAGAFGIMPLRASLVGIAAGAVIAVLWNVVDPTPAPCLQSAKGWDILRAYSFCK